jgi:hypothetical protein
MMKAWATLIMTKERELNKCERYLEERQKLVVVGIWGLRKRKVLRIMPRFWHRSLRQVTEDSLAVQL